jgi:hypothetical protein
VATESCDHHVHPQKALSATEVGQLVTGAVPAEDANVSRATYGLTTLVGHNTFGEATEQQDEYGNVSINRYDALGRMVEQQSPVYTATLPARRRTPTTTRAARGRWRTRPPG